MIAFIAGILNPIPYFGLLIGIGVGVLITLLGNEPSVLMYCITIVTTILGINFINAFFLEPKIAGNKVGLHPILMIISIFIFNSLFGIIGMLIAVPTMAVVVTLVQDLYKYYTSNNTDTSNELQQ